MGQRGRRPLRANLRANPIRISRTCRPRQAHRPNLATPLSRPPQRLQDRCPRPLHPIRNPRLRAINLAAMQSSRRCRAQHLSPRHQQTSHLGPRIVVRALRGAARRHSRRQNPRQSPKRAATLPRPSQHLRQRKSSRVRHQRSRRICRRCLLRRSSAWLKHSSRCPSPGRMRSGWRSRERSSEAKLARCLRTCRPNSAIRR